ncbi:unnamed protein product [Leuciscus chuanchicus]
MDDSCGVYQDFCALRLDKVYSMKVQLDPDLIIVWTKERGAGQRRAVGQVPDQRWPAQISLSAGFVLLSLRHEPGNLTLFAIGILTYPTHTGRITHISSTRSRTTRRLARLTYTPFMRSPEREAGRPPRDLWDQGILLACALQTSEQYTDLPEQTLVSTSDKKAKNPACPSGTQTCTSPSFTNTAPYATHADSAGFWLSGINNSRLSGLVVLTASRGPCKQPAHIHVILVNRDPPLFHCTYSRTTGNLSKSPLSLNSFIKTGGRAAGVWR